MDRNKGDCDGYRLVSTTLGDSYTIHQYTELSGPFSLRPCPRECQYCTWDAYCEDIRLSTSTCYAHFVHYHRKISLLSKIMLYSSLVRFLHSLMQPHFFGLSLGNFPCSCMSAMTHLPYWSMGIGFMTL